ncbi:hypothetical protein THOM_0278 [Trachipleistophora hominis]|uniref:Uncharacterized protein n=1 Tax=Trachipleistophora hominis TaxID=72359 RepID=L7JZ82_TRAHO|nr:hypothetical protein THOM_0278 [Trachipleistophora hominis]
MVLRSAFRNGRGAFDMVSWRDVDVWLFIFMCIFGSVIFLFFCGDGQGYVIKDVEGFV